MSVIICATGPVESGKSEFCDRLRSLEPDSIGFESSQLIIEIANECNAYLAARHRAEPDALHTEESYYKVVNDVLVKIQANHAQLFDEEADIRFTASETIEHPEQFETLRQYVKDLLLYPEIVSQRITTANKDTYRPFLKWLGGYMVYKAKPTVWFDEIGRRIKRYQPEPSFVTVNALRYPSDETAMREFARDNGHQCIVVEVCRPGTTEGTDVTEASRSNIHSDCRIINNGSIDDLAGAAKHLVHDIKKQRLQPEYHAR